MTWNFFKKFLFTPIIIIFYLCLPLFGAGAENIRLNQIGFYVFGPKTAIVVSSQAWRFSVKSPDLSTTYHTGQLSLPKKWDASGEVVAIADFSEFTRPGAYVLEVSGAGISYPFRIGASVHNDLLRGLIRMFYYQRAGASLPEQYAGQWNRIAGHPDMNVIIHASAVSDSTALHPRKEGETYASPGGWYDAGDYGKYVVNAGISVYTLLALYEQFPVFFDTFSLNIPRPINRLPDLLTEIKWELDWLLTMQDPADGGVYHKLTSLGFCGFIMPSQDVAGRYFIGKGSAATFDFAAVGAVAARIYKKSLPGFADSCLAAAQRAWKWGSVNPNKRFSNPDGVTTGEYGNGNLQDEQNWAANELFIATGDSTYRQAAEKLSVSYPVPGWPDVAMLGMYSLASVKNDSTATARIMAKAKSMAAIAAGAPYRTLPFGIGDFYWGSNAVAASYGMILIEAFLATADSTYFERAVDILDYLVGRNAVGTSFVTGFGSKSPLSPHHRISSADGIAAPLPGLLVGGPNRTLQSDEGSACGAGAYTEKFAAKTWIDNECSYGSNENAVNWNAPAAFLAGAIEAIYADPRFHVKRTSNNSFSTMIDSITVTGNGADRVTIAWKTDKAVSSSIQYAIDSTFTNAHQKFSDGTTLHSVSLLGLTPGVEYRYRINCCDDGGNFSESQVLTFTTSPSPLAAAFSFDPSSLKVVPGGDVVVAFQATTAISATLLYWKGGDGLMKQAPCSEMSGQYQATIPAADITAAGILIAFILRSAADTITTQKWAVAAASPLTYSETLPHSSAYNLLSLPIPVPIVNSLDFFSTLLGDNSFWRYFGYDALSGKYVPNAIIGGGRGGWLYAGEKRTLSMTAAALKPDTLFPISLSQGWNCIGIPFSFPVFWENSMVRSEGKIMRLFDNGARQLLRRQLFSYSDTSADRMNNGRYFSNRDILSSDSTRLLPWQGYWVYAEKEGIDLIINPAAEMPGMPMAKKTREDGGQWQIRFSLEANGTLDNAAVIGESALASDGYDEFDSPKPPAASDGAIVGLLHPRLHGSVAMFASDILSSSTTGNHEWRLRVSAKPGRENIVLSWEATGKVIGFVYLRDEVADATIDMGRTGTYTFSLLPGESGRLLTVAKSAVKDNRFASLPAGWSLHHCAPNPFRQATVFTFSVPGRSVGEISARSMSIVVYDIGGRRLRTLFKGLRDPGIHSMLWDGTDDNHKRLRQGIYIVRFCADGFSGSLMTHLMD